MISRILILCGWGVSVWGVYMWQGLWPAVAAFGFTAMLAGSTGVLEAVEAVLEDVRQLLLRREGL